MENIKVKYFDIRGNEVSTAAQAVKAEVYYYSQHNELEKIEYFHSTPKPKNTPEIST